MIRLSRRQFLTRSLAAGATIGAAHFLPGCGTTTAAIEAPIPPLNPTGLPARVAAVRGSDLARMVRDAFDAFGGASAIVHPGETVFLKPNLVGAGMVKHDLFSTGECTKIEIIIAVAEECLRAGAALVTIGDAGQVRQFSWDDLRTLDNSTTLPAEVQRLNNTYGERVSLACLNADSPAWDAIVSPYSGLDQILISSLAARADRVISLPVIKTHRFAQVSLSLKNFMGVTSSEYYGEGALTFRSKLHHAPGGLEQTFLDIVAALRPDFTLIDASIGCEGNGPHVLPGWWGTTVDVRERLGEWLMLASNDLVAADATAARIIGHDPAAVRHIALAYDRGLGQMRQELITLAGASLDELRMDWQPAEHAADFDAVILPGLMMLLEEPV